MESKIKGKVVAITPVEQIGDKLTKKQTIVIEESTGEYPDSVAIEAYGDAKVEQLEGIKVGDEVTAYFNLKAREWKGRWFQGAGLWKIKSGYEVETSVSFTSDEDDALGF